MRRFDKTKNMQKANLINESLYLVNKNPLYLIEGVMAIDDDDFENENLINKWLFESMIECGVNLENLIAEGKEVITESLIAAGIGVLLATGKFIDVIGVLFRKIRNQMVKWGWLGQDAKTWDKTKAEEFGDWWKEKIIDPIFKAAARVLLGVVGIGVTTFLGVMNPNENKDYMAEIMTEQNISDVAAVLFYGTITALSLTAVFGGIASLVHHGQIWAAVAEKLATGTKFYEIMLLIVAFFFTMFIEVYKPFKTKLFDFSHALGECLEGNSFMKILKGIGKAANSQKEKIVSCVNHHLHVGGEHGDKHGAEHGQQPQQGQQPQHT